MTDLFNKCFENCTYSAKWHPPDGNKTNTADEDHLYRVSFENIPLKGLHLYVFKGKAYSSQEVYSRSVVVKGMRRYSGSSKDFMIYELCNETGRVMANAFNKVLGNHSMEVNSYTEIRFVVPAVSTVDDRAAVTKLLQYKKFERDEAVIFEEKIKGKFGTFVDKRGESSSMDDSLVLEAFCHFTYIASNKDYVICGLKGVQSKLKDKSIYTLTNPTIHSTDGRFGPKDKRDPGIKDVLDNHICNKFCSIFMKDKHFGECK